MPFGGAYYDTSMDKHEDTMRMSRMSRRRGFRIGRVVGDPFALASISIAILAWLIALVASIIARLNTSYPNYAWWAIAHMFCVIVGIIIMVGSDAIYTYHVAAVGFLSYGLFLTTSAANATIYSPNGAEDAAAAGFILLSIVSIVWVFVFGSQPQAGPRQFIDSFALHKSTEDRPSPRSSRHMSSRHFDQPHMNSLPRQYHSGHLPGFEASSPVMNQSNYGNTGNAALPNRLSQPGLENRTSAVHFGKNAALDAGSAGNIDQTATQPTEYPYKARAIYSYDANVDDPNEISFTRNEILQISDVSGRWWQAKKDNGEAGIAPSNYLILL